MARFGLRGFPAVEGSVSSGSAAWACSWFASGFRSLRAGQRRAAVGGGPLILPHDQRGLPARSPWASSLSSCPPESPGPAALAGRLGRSDGDFGLPVGYQMPAGGAHDPNRLQIGSLRFSGFSGFFVVSPGFAAGFPTPLGLF